MGLLDYFFKSIYIISVRSTLGRVSLFVGFLWALIGNVDTDHTIYGVEVSLIGILLVFAIGVSLLLSRKYLFNIKIKVRQKDVDKDISKNGIIDVSNAKPDDSEEVEVVMDVPDYYDDLFLSWNVTGYSVSATQEDPLNYDNDRGLTSHSKVGTAEFNFLISAKSENQDGTEVPFIVEDKINGKVVEEFTFCHKEDIIIPSWRDKVLRPLREKITKK